MRLASEDSLQRSQMENIYGGSGSGSQLSYCGNMYMIRSCNNLEGSAMSGWQYGWTSNGCNATGGATYWDHQASQGYNMQHCNTNWYGY